MPARISQAFGLFKRQDMKVGLGKAESGDRGEDSLLSEWMRAHLL
jgi:hypothetical protein